MDSKTMKRIFQAHRDAEAARDYDGILATFVEDCFLDTVPLGLRTVGRTAVRAAYEGSYFAAFPDLTPEDQGYAFGDDAVVAWGTLNGTSRGPWLGIPPSGRSFSVRFTNVAHFRDELMHGESIYFDLATLCEQAGLPLDEIRAAAMDRARALATEGNR
ncbi:ester cyclase [Pseudonocardia saturnea]